MLKNKGITFRLTILIMSSTVLIVSALLIINFIISAEFMKDNLKSKAESIANEAVSRIEVILEAAERSTKTIAFFIESAQPDIKETRKVMANAVASTPEIYGSAIGYEPYSYDSSINLLSDYYYRKNGEIKYGDLSEPNYNYLSWNWYQEPKRLGKPVWSEPYFDEGGGNILMSTFSVPFYKKINGELTFNGVMTADLSLTWLSDYLASIKPYKSSYAFIISQKGVLVSFPNKDFVMKLTMSQLGKDANSPMLESIQSDMLSGKSGYIEFKSDYNGKEGYLCYAPIKVNGWSLAVFYPTDELMEDMMFLIYLLIIISIAGFIALFFIISSISNSIAKPMVAATKASEAIAKGNIDLAFKISSEAGDRQSRDLTSRRSSVGMRLPVKSKDKPGFILPNTKNEIARLVFSIKQMCINLNSLIGQVHKSGLQVTTSSTEISASARQLEATIAEQAASTSEVTSTAFEISNTSDRLVGTMEELGAQIGDTAFMAEDGKGYLNKMERSMQNLIKATTAIASQLSIISDKAHKISNVVVSINKISDQTNLLSLNAAIEAEKAGEYGKGFSVVSREISRLADQTAIATQDIEFMVKAMQSSVTSGVMEMDKFAEEVRKGVHEVAQTGEELTKIIDRVRLIVPQFDDVKEGMQAQAESGQQISETMNQLSQAANQTKESLSEFRLATQQLNEAVFGLKNEVSRFKVNS
ncbi:MAG: Methyl-accepting transducer protein [Bacteroidota bacterium]|nr:Methyl-accepting transducer protein [Bacteroidota bacterium]